MKNNISVGLFSLILLFSGCAGFQAAREVNSGRQAYLIGNNEAAYAHFQKAAQADPQYVYGTALRQEFGVTSVEYIMTWDGFRKSARRLNGRLRLIAKRILPGFISASR